MVRRIWHKLQTTVAGGAIIIGVASILSKILGLIRDRLLFSRFGAGDTTDIYFAAFKIPDFLFTILVLGALSSAFIPVFIEYWQKGTPEARKEAWDIANAVNTLLIVTLAITAAIAAVFAPLLVSWIAPGFEGAKHDQTVLLTRIMLLSVLFFAASNVVSGLLNAFRKFLAYSLAPALYNVGIIIGIVLFYPRVGIIGLAWGVSLGAVLHFLVQLPSVRRIGFRYQWKFDWRLTGVRQIFRLLIPRAMALAISQVQFLVITIVASTLAVGTLSIFNFANNLQSVPISIFGVSLAIAAFPVMSEAFAEGNAAKFVVHFSVTFRRILYVVVPASILILLLRAQIVRVVYGTGNVGWTETYLTAQTLGIFALSLVAQSLLPMLARSFYSRQDTRTPLFASVAALVLNVAGAVSLGSSLGVLGLAIAYSVASVANAVILLAALRIRFGDLDDAAITQSVVKIVVASIVMAAAVWLTLRVVALGVDMRTFVGILLQGGIAGTVGIFAYLLVTLFLKSDEIQIFAQWLRNLQQSLRNGNGRGR